MEEDDFFPAPPELAAWFSRSARTLPWRDRPVGARDPWRTLVSEVMSQQTRLEVVVPRFEQWFRRFPEAASLAGAGEAEVLSMWAGLGYYARARALHRLARQVTESGWPGDSAGLQRLPGIGPYTAAAVASLCFGERVAALDGNMERVLARIHALSGNLRSGEGRRDLGRAAKVWVSLGHPGLVNEATMELGALVCTPRSPRCELCPIGTNCRAGAREEAELYPMARIRAGTVEVRQTAFVLEGPEGVLLRKAEPGELLAGLWTLPVADGDGARLPEAWRGLRVEESSFAAKGTVRHAITCHRIAWRVIRARALGNAPQGMSWFPREQLPHVLVSSLPVKALRLSDVLSAT
jgi:A/G-specific adenine glycosylase